jgi:hypothetical protein
MEPGEGVGEQRRELGDDRSLGVEDELDSGFRDPSSPDIMIR